MTFENEHYCSEGDSELKDIPRLVQAILHRDPLFNLY